MGYSLNLREMVMEARPDWNSMGPRLPPWFRLALARVDRHLVLQFIPAREEQLNDGVDPQQFPHGVWAICHKMRGSGWLLKRWTWSLSDNKGCYQEPGADTIEMLRMARDLWRIGCVDTLERRMEDAIEAIKSERVQKSKERTNAHLQELCRAHNIISSHSRVFVRKPSAVSPQPSAKAVS